MPRYPSTNCGKKVRLNPMKMMAAAIFAQNSG